MFLSFQITIKIFFKTAYGNTQLEITEPDIGRLTNIKSGFVVVVVALLFYVHGKHLRSCRDGQLT